MSVNPPNYSLDFNFIDTDAQIIAEYLYQGVRSTFTNYQIDLIKTYRTWNDVQIPTIDYPVLKVYATGETAFKDTEYISTRFTIAYGLAFTLKQKVADVSRVVTKELIRQLVNASQFQINWDEGLTTTYETLVTPDNQVYRYAVIEVSIYTRLDGCNCCDSD